MQPATASQFIPTGIEIGVRPLLRRIGHTAWGQCIGYVKTRNSNPIVGHP